MPCQIEAMTINLLLLIVEDACALCALGQKSAQN